MSLQDKNDMFKVRTNILRMLKIRGYIIPEEEENIDAELFSIKYDNNDLDIYIENENPLNPDDSRKMYVKFIMDDTFSKKDLTSNFEDIVMEYDENINIIFILQKKENAIITKELMKDSYRNTEIFLKSEMKIDKHEQELCPSYEILNAEQETEYLERYTTKKSLLPRISHLDPMAKYYRLHVGQMIKVVYPDDIYYRVVN